MNLNTILELFALITKGAEEIPTRSRGLNLRKSIFNSLSNPGFTKIAFDTRRINQETELNPRRGLQNYNRSEAFLSQGISDKLKLFAKLKKVLNSLKDKFGKEPEWHDSNARILLSTLEKGLRSDFHDGDYTESQPGVGNLNYIEELLHVRYRLTFDQIEHVSESELKKIILSKDEGLIHKDVNNALEITKNDVMNQSYDTLVDKLFNGIKATQENPEVERTITITIKDSIKGS